MTDLKEMAAQAVDLGKLRDDQRLADDAATDRAIQERQAAEYEKARQWHKAMRRAFKGIYSDRLRLANLSRYTQEHGDADAD